MSKVLLGSRDYEPLDLTVEVNVANSFGDIASSAIWGDVSNLILGFSIVFIYVNFMLVKFNMVEQSRALIAMNTSYLLIVLLLRATYH